LLRIDLLPRTFEIARRNKVVMAVMVLALILALAGWGFAVVKIRSDIARTQQEYDAAHAEAEKVRAIEKETQAKQAELAPIAAKVDFVSQADRCGEQFWDRFYSISQYIPENAQLTRISITPPNSVNFSVIVGDTTECARFVLNLIKCPALSEVSISGLPAGLSIRGVGSAGGRATFRAQAGAAEAAMPGAEAEMPAAEAPGMGPGGLAGGPGAAVTRPGGPEEIRLEIAGVLAQSVSEPAPPGAGAAPAAGPGGPGVGPEMAPGAETGAEIPAGEGPGAPAGEGAGAGVEEGAGGAEEPISEE